MAGSLGTLTLDLIAKIGGFTGPMDKAGRAAKQSSSEMVVAAKQAALAWSALGEVAAGVVAGFSVASIFGRFVTETRNAEKEQAQLGAVLRSTGESAGYNRTQLNEMADAMARATTFSGGDITQAQTTLLAFTGVVGNQFNKALQSAADMAARTGKTVKEAAELIGRALDVPSEGLSALTKQGFRFTEDQKKLALAMESTGNVAGAQGIILKALNESYGGAAAAARDTFGGALEALHNTVSDLLTGEGSLDSAKAAVFALNDALASPGAKTAIETLGKAAIALTVVLSTRLAGAALTSAASLAAAQVEAIRYQAALARMAGVSGPAAAGLISVGVAARAASAAMALLGGPFGAILLAGSALTYFVTRASEADRASAELDERIGKLDSTFLSLSSNQAAAAIPDYTKKLESASMAAAAVSAKVFTLNDNISRFPQSPSQEKWQAQLVQAKGELDTATQAVDGLKSKIEELNAVVAKSSVSSAAADVSKVYKEMSRSLDEQIAVAGKRTNAEKLAARISGGFLEGLKAGEGDLLVAKQRNIDAIEKTMAANKKAEEAAKASEKADAAALKKRGDDAEESYQRQIELINTTVDKRNKASEASKLSFEIESGKLVGINAEQQKRLQGLADELDAKLKLKKQNEDDAKLAAFRATLTDSNQVVRQGFEIELAGSGSGDKLKERLKEDLAIQQDYQKQLSELNKQLNTGQINKDLYDKETEMLRQALAERMDLQRGYYSQVDKEQSNWVAGASSAYENYLDSARDVAGQTKSLFTNAFTSMEDAVVSFSTTGKFSFTDFAKSVLADMARIAARQATSSALSSLFGLASSAAGSYFGGPASAGSTQAGYSSTYFPQAKGGAWSDGVQLFANGGAFTNGVVSQPTAFGMANGKAGVMGEAGAEAIMPLTRTSSGALGVRAVGGGQGSSNQVIIQQNFTVPEGQGGGADATSGQAVAQAYAKAAKQGAADQIARDLKPGGQIWTAINGRS